MAANRKARESRVDCVSENPAAVEHKLGFSQQASADCGQPMKTLGGGAKACRHPIQPALGLVFLGVL